jgi:outer membrane protein TolC
MALSLALAFVMSAPGAFAASSKYSRPPKADATLQVSQDISGEGAAMQSAKDHIAASGEVSVEAASSNASSTGQGVQEFEDGFSASTEGNGGGPLTFSLDDCISRALDRNMRLKAADEDMEAAEGQLTEAKAAFWPVMEYNYRMAPVPTDVDDAWSKFWAGDVTFFNSIHVGIGMPILTFGQLLMAKQLAKGGVEAARIRHRQTESDVIFQVKQLYYGIQFAQESIKLLNEAVGKLDSKIESNAPEFEENGDSGDELEDVNSRMDPYDVLKLRAFKAELERRLDEAQQNLALAYDALRFQLDLEPGAEVDLDSHNLKPKLASLDQEAKFVDGGMQHQPEVNLLDIGVETRKRQFKLEKYKLLPRAGFGFFVDVGRSAGQIRGLQLTDDYNDPFNYTRAGLGLQLKGTIDFHGAYGRIKKARAEYHKAVYERMIGRRALTTDIRKAYLEAKRAKENVARTQKEWSLANQMMFLSKVNIDIGLGDNDKYAEALKYMLISRGSYFKAVFDYNVALAELEKRVGRDRYGEYVPTPVADEFGGFEEEEEGDDGWVTMGEQEDTYGVQTEDGGTTEGAVNE